MAFIVWIILCTISCVIDFCAPEIFIRGKGASFPSEVYKSWIPAYKAYRQKHVSLVMDYDAVGSGSGKAAIKANVDIEYAGSDSLLSATDRQSHQDLIEFPTMAGAIVMGYNLPSLEQSLRLTMEQLVGIYNGTYTHWNDSTFKQNNPNCTLPSKKIVVIARYDKSGSTSLFTSALSSADSNWNDTYGTFSKGVDKDEKPYHWNENAVAYYGITTRGVSGLLLSFKYSIAYLSVADIQDGLFDVALLENKDKQYVSATSTAVQSAMDFFATQTRDLTFSLSYGHGNQSYPIAGFTQFIIYKTQMKNCASAKELLRYIDWFLNSNTPRADCEQLGFAPLSSDLVKRVEENVLKVVTCAGRNVWEQVLRDMEQEGKETETSWIIPVAVAVPLVIVIISGLAGCIIHERLKYWRMLSSNDWDIPIEDIVFYYDERINSLEKSRSGFTRSLKSLRSAQTSFEKYELDALVTKILQWPGKWKGYDIGLRLLEIKGYQTITKDMKQEMLRIRDRIAHPNVVRFYGLTEMEGDRYVIQEYCRKGSLTDILQDNKLNLTNDFKLALSLDICQGMMFLHAQNVCHGQLCSMTCFVDSKWTVKIGDWENIRLLAVSNENYNLLDYILNDNNSDQINRLREFWVAPEILRCDFKCKATPEADVYSYAIVLQEIYTQQEPYVEHANTSNIQEIVRAIVSNNLRPQSHLEIPMTIRQIMEIGWTDSPLSRPSFDQISKFLKQNNPLRKSVMDSVIQSMEDYTNHLEECIEEKTNQVSTIQLKMDTFMSNLIPSDLSPKIDARENIQQFDYKILGLVCLEISNREKHFHGLSSKEKLGSLRKLISYIDVIKQKYSAFRYTTTGNSVTILVGIGDADKSEEYVALKTAHICFDIVSLENVHEANCSVDELNPFKFNVGAHVSQTSTGMIDGQIPQFVLLGDMLEIVGGLARSSSASMIHVSKQLKKMLDNSHVFSSERAGILTVKNTEYKTYWLTGRSEKQIEKTQYQVAALETISLTESKNCLTGTQNGNNSNEKSKREKEMLKRTIKKSNQICSSKPKFSSQTSKVYPEIFEVKVDVH